MKKTIALLLALALLLPTALSSVALENGGESADAQSAQNEPFDYSSLYVDDSLVISFSAYGKTAGDAPTSLTDDLGNSFSVGADAVWGDGALLNRGTVVDFTAAQGTKLNDSSYTYEFVLGYEEQVSTVTSATKGGALDIGYLTYKVPHVLDGSAYTYAYAPIENGTAGTWVYDFGKYVWTKMPLLDAEEGEVIELTQTGELSEDTSTGTTVKTIAFSTYREGEFVGRIAKNDACPYFEYVPTLSCKLGKNFNMKIYAVRVYSDIISEQEIAQNHFADVARYYALDVSAYLTLTDAERTNVNRAFKSVRIGEDDTTVQAFLDMLVALKGNLPPIRLEKVLSFDGYSVCLWGDASVRAEFSLDENLLTSALSQNYIIECGGVVAPKDATGELIRFDSESLAFVAADPSYCQTTAYCSDFDYEIPEKITAQTSFTPEESVLYRNDELLFKAYIGITDFENSYVIYFDAESERFGDTVSMSTLYEHFLLNGYVSYPSVFSFADQTLLDVLNAVDSELTAARNALATAEKALETVEMLNQLESSSFASAETVGRETYDAYSDAYTAFLAYHARKTEVKAFPDKLASLESAIDTLEAKITENLSELSSDEQTNYVKKFTSVLRESADALTEAGDSLTVDSALGTQYESTLFTLTQTATPTARENKTLNTAALDEYIIFADKDDRAARLLATTLLSEYGLLLPLIDETLYDFVGDIYPSIHLDPARTHEVYGQSVLAYDGQTLTLYGNAQNSIYHAVLKLLALFKTQDIVTVESQITATPQETLMQTYAVDSFFRPDGTLDTDSSEPLTIVCIGGSLTQLGDQWVQMIKAYFEQRFPLRPVTVYNAGVSGTPSELGAARFAHDVLSKNPDLVIIEFSVNDMLINASKNSSQESMESMLNACLQSEKIPGVIFAHTPPAVDKDHASYASFQNQVKWKNEVAEHYGVSVVNIYDYFYRCYEKKAAETNQGNLTYSDYVSDIYKLQADGTYDVHPIDSGRGYKMYAEAFIEAFECDLASMLTRLKFTDIHSKNQETAAASHQCVPQNSDRITYEGTWEEWTNDRPYNNADANASIGTDRYVYPFFEDGIRRAYKQSGAAFSFKTTASEISLYCYTAKAGAKATVYVNGTKVGTVTTKMTAQQPFQTASVSLGNPSGQEVTVRIVIDEPTDSQYVFQFGYIIETFK